MTNTPELEGLQGKLKSLGIESPVPDYANSHILQNSTNIYRAYLADLLTPLVDAVRKLVYDSIQWTFKYRAGQEGATYRLWQSTRYVEKARECHIMERLAG